MHGQAPCDMEPCWAWPSAKKRYLLLCRRGAVVECGAFPDLNNLRCMPVWCHTTRYMQNLAAYRSGPATSTVKGRMMRCLCQTTGILQGIEFSGHYPKQAMCPPCCVRKTGTGHLRFHIQCASHSDQMVNLNNGVSTPGAFLYRHGQHKINVLSSLDMVEDHGSFFSLTNMFYTNYSVAASAEREGERQLA